MYFFLNTKLFGERNLDFIRLLLPSARIYSNFLFALLVFKCVLKKSDDLANFVSQQQANDM
jgi:hypothetical protein